jgi:hypothetical protein
MTSLPYEERLRRSFDLALRESSAHFGSASAVDDTLNRLATRLDAAGIPYVLIGALALGAHGYIRMASVITLDTAAHQGRRWPLSQRDRAVQSYD